MKKASITVGIPAYNEEANIKKLLTRILRQKQVNFTIREILVVSDHSTDSTNKIIRKFNSKKIRLLINKKRSGQAYAQNRILKHAKGEILVLLNADVLPLNSLFINRLIQPIIEKSADLTAAKVWPARPTSYFESVLYVSNLVKRDIFEKYKSGNNLYTCHGRARAFSKRLFSKMKFEFSVDEDAYSYLECQARGYKYKYVKEAVVLYGLPATLKDHQKQSMRFLQKKDLLSEKFGEKFVSKHYKISFVLTLRSFVKHFVIHPLQVTAYVCILFFTKLETLHKNSVANSNIWSVSKSSKSIK